MKGEMRTEESTVAKIKVAKGKCFLVLSGR